VVVVVVPYQINHPRVLLKVNCQENVLRDIISVILWDRSDSENERVNLRPGSSDAELSAIYSAGINGRSTVSGQQAPSMANLPVNQTVKEVYSINWSSRGFWRFRCSLPNRRVLSPIVAPGVTTCTGHREVTVEPEVWTWNHGRPTAVAVQVIWLVKSSKSYWPLSSSNRV